MSSRDTAHDGDSARWRRRPAEVAEPGEAAYEATEQPPRRSELPRIRPARAVLGVVLGAALVAGATAIIGHIAQFSRLRHGIAEMGVGWLVIAVAGKASGYAGYITAYRHIAAMFAGPVLRAWAATRVVALGFGATIVGSAAGGLATDYWALHRAGCSGDDSLRRVLGLNTLQWLALGSLAAVAGLLAVVGVVPDVPMGMALGWPVALGICLAAGSWVSAPGRVERFSTAPEPPPLEQRSPATVTRWSLAWMRRGLADAIGGLLIVRAAVAHPHQHFWAGTGLTVYWIGDLITLWACIQAFDGHLTVPALVLAYATGYVATALPLPVGGAGGVDAAMALTLHAVGLPLATALLTAVIYRGVSFWLPAIPALILLRGVHDLADELDGVAASRQGRPA